uniref:Uncharacterized protein n=1 Tax=Anguilla anguilla TaxID=7936 RepID=A0A0E9W4T9_ANGAN
MSFSHCLLHIFVPSVV